MPLVGLKDLYYAKMTEDAAGGVTYETPIHILGAVSANINPNPSSETFFGDDGPMETSATLGSIDLELVTADFPLEVQADLLGHSIVGGIMKSNASDTPPWVAVGFRSLKSNGHYRYVWLLKGKFQEPEAAHETKGESTKFQTPTMKGSFVKRDYDDNWKYTADEDHADYLAAIGSGWFTSVEQSADTSAPTVSVVPADNATGVAVSANVVWTFNEAIQAALVTAANFMVTTAAGVAIAGALSINAAHTEVTFNPTSNLTGSTEHLAIVSTAVKNMAGIALAAPSVTSFTTA